MQLPMPGIHTPSTLQQRITTTPFTFAIALGVPRTPAPRPPPPARTIGRVRQQLHRTPNRQRILMRLHENGSDGSSVKVMAE